MYSIGFLARFTMRLNLFVIFLMFHLCMGPLDRFELPQKDLEASVLPLHHSGAFLSFPPELS